MTEMTARLRSPIVVQLTVARRAAQARLPGQPPGPPPPAHAVARRMQEDAAVQVEHLPLHPARLGRAEKRHQRRDLGRLADGTQRRRALHLLEERLPARLVAEGERDAVLIHAAGAYVIDVDPA